MLREALRPVASTRGWALPAVVALILSSTPLPSLGEDGLLYKWEDAQGQVHYSDRPPAGPAISVERYALPAQAPTEPSPEGDYYSVENQAKRLEQARLERESARAARARERQEEERRAAELEALRKPPETPAPQPPLDRYPVYTLPFPPPWPAYPHRPSHRPHPPHPPHPPLGRPKEPKPEARPGAALLPWRR